MEQFTYTPFAMTSFYFGMTLLEGNTVEDAKKEVQAKFLPTYKVCNSSTHFHGHGLTKKLQVF